MNLRGVILDRDSFDRGDIDLSPLLQSLPDWSHHASSKNHQVAKRISDCEVVITNKVVIGEQEINQAPQLKLILLAATGTDNVDLDACREKGITVCNVREYSTPSVVQHTFTLILNLMTRMPRYLEDVNEKAWQQSPVFCLLNHPIRELQDKQLGIVGLGNLGSKVATVAEAFGMKVSVSQRPGGAPQAGRVAFDQLLAESDIITLHCPLTPDTRDLFSTKEFEMMKSDALIINTARGAIINSEALVAALRNGMIGGAGIDVLDQEPPGEAHPLVQEDIPNLVLTPHNAWASIETRQRLVSHLAANLNAWKQGNPINTV